MLRAILARHYIRKGSVLQLTLCFWTSSPHRGKNRVILSPSCWPAAAQGRPGELGMKGQKTAIWIAVGIAVGVAIGAATHAMAMWICVGVVADAWIGAVVGRR